MKPIAICQHEATQGPGYLLTVLQRHAIPHRVFAIHAGETPPNRASEYGGIVILGSNASANDGTAWMRREDALLQDALRLSCPILGHCFGGQMLARALGGKVRRNSVPQIGWGKVLGTVFPEARHWLGPQRELELFHWHFDTFEIPRGAKRILFGHYCMNKAFACGPHIGLQSHLEVTVESIRDWCREDAATLQHWQHLPSVQSAAEILGNAPVKTARLHRLADHLYLRWLAQIPGALQEMRTTGSCDLRPRGGSSWGAVLGSTT